jgi:hypothetical protein
MGAHLVQLGKIAAHQPEDFGRNAQHDDRLRG